MTVTRQMIEAAKTPEESRKLIAQLTDDFAELRGELQRKDTTITEHAGLLKRAQQRIAELEQNLSAGQSTWGGEGEGELSRFLEEDGKVRLGTNKRAQERGDHAPVGLLDGEPVCEWQRELQQVFEVRTLVRTIHGYGDHAIRWTGAHNPNSVTPDADARIRKLIQGAPGKLSAAMRAMGDNSGQGGDYIVPPTLNSIRDNIHVESTVGGLFTQVPMQGGGVDIPTVDGGLVPFRRGLPSGRAPGNIPLTTLATGKDTVRPQDLGLATAFHERASERSIFNFMEIIRMKGGRAMMYALADTIVNANGSTAAIDSYAPGGVHWDPRSIFGYAEAEGYPVAIDRRNGIWEGLRNRAKRIDASGSTHWVDASTWSLDVLQQSLARIQGPLGADGDLILLASREAYFRHIVTMDQLQTVEKYGPRATVHTKEVGSVAGARVVIDDFVTGDLNASGVYDGATTTKTSMQLFNRLEWLLYLETGVRIQTKVEILNGLVYVVFTWGGQFNCNAPSARKNIINFYNMSAQ